MEIFIMWVGFIGSWVLFAGSIYQAALELQDEDIEFDRIRATGSKIKQPPAISNWWWFLPPIKFYLEFKRGKQNRDEIIRALSTEDVEAMISFNSKSKAWLFVAFGGFCLAVKETFELCEINEWGNVTFAALVVAMFVLCILNLVYNVRRARNAKSKI